LPAALVFFLFRGADDEELGHGGNGYPCAGLKAEVLEPIAAEFDFGDVFLAVLVVACFGLDF